MSESTRGIFDRSAKGRSTRSVPVEVERGRVRFFASVLGEADPVHHDLAIAHAKGHPDLLASPSFFAVIEAEASAILERGGELSALGLVGADFRYLLHGDETYDFLGPIYCGECLTVTTTVVDFYDRKGGDLEFATLRTSVSHPQRGELMGATRTLVHRLPPGAQE